MKTRFLLPAILLGMATFTNSYAQNMLFQASLVEQQIANPMQYGYPNTYTIDYSPFCACASRPQLSALVADDGVNPPTIYINDQVSPLMPWTNAAVPAPGGSAPDVVIGNDFLNPGQYIAGVVAINAGVVQLYLYHITGVGTALFSIAGPYATFNISGVAGCTGPAHIDAIAKSSNPYMGLPSVDRYVITWQNGPKIFGCPGSLNGAPGIMQVIANSPTISSPDVAAVERINALFNFEDWALFSYVDLTNNKLYYQEWNVTTNTVLPAITYDNAHAFINPFPGVASVARIDAIDNYNLNAPGGGNAYFVITASAPIPAFLAPRSSVFEYNNITGPGVATNITLSITLPNPGLFKATNEIPVVACGPGQFYSVGYYSQPVSSSGGPQQGYFVTAINWSTGLPTTNPNAYMTNKIGYDPAFAPGLALSGTCNNNTMGQQQLFAGWENYNFEYTKYTSTIPYAYKPAEQPVIQAASSEWQLYPNPASEIVTLAAPAGFNVTDNATYHISDLTGKTLMKNTVNNANQEINISNLPAGMYLINIYANEASTKTIKFVKE